MLAAFHENHVPLIILESDVRNSHSVACDNFRGGYLAGEYPIQQQKREIIIVTGNLALANNVETKRLAGFQAALADNGIDFNPRSQFQVIRHLPDASEECLEAILAEHSRPRAIFCAAGDACAIGLIHAARNRGFKIPEDLAILGFDDQEIAACAFPPLTTMRQPGLEMGTAAVEIALECLADTCDGEPLIIHFQPELVIRQSV